MNAAIAWMLIGAFIGLSLDLYGHVTKRTIYPELYIYGKQILPSKSVLVEVILWPASAWSLLKVITQDLLAAWARGYNDD